VTTAVRYDPFAHELHDDPYPVYRILRDEHPAYFVEQHGFWVLSRYDDVRSALRDWQSFSSAGGNVVDDPPERVGRTLGTTDPPRHDELKAIVNTAFTVKRVTTLEGVMRTYVQELVAACGERDSFDVVADLSAPFTSRVMGDLLGIPRADHDQMKAWRNAMVHREPNRMGFTVEGQAAFKDLLAYTLQLVQSRKASLGEDLISDLVKAEAGGIRLSDDEIAVTALTVLGAGFQSMNYFVSNAVHALALHEGARREVVADLGLVPQALEEVLRWDSPAQGFARTMTGDRELHGQQLRQGERVLLLLGSANRDDRFFPDADTFDIHRGQVRHLAFGMGTHFCIGASLGRLAGRIAIEELLTAVPDHAVDRSSIGRIHSPTFRGFQRLVIHRT
jgi:cytochrome P450